MCGTNASRQRKAFAEPRTFHTDTPTCSEFGEKGGRVARGRSGVSSHAQIFAPRSPCRAGTDGDGKRAGRTGWGRDVRPGRSAVRQTEGSGATLRSLDFLPAAGAVGCP